MADMSASTERPTIDEVLLEFLDDQQRRLSPRTWRRYADVVELWRACLNGYGYQSLPETDQARWEATYDTVELDELPAGRWSAAKVRRGLITSATPRVSSRTNGSLCS